MTIQALSMAWDAKKLSPLEKLVLLCIADEVSNIKAMADRCNVSTDKALRAVKSLEKKKLIKTSAFNPARLVVVGDF